MKSFVLIFSFVIFSGLAIGQTKTPHISTLDSTKKIIKGEIACGQCQFHLKGVGCNLAVKINGKAYFVDGAGIDDFGDAHEKDGFCNAASKAEVQGKVVNNLFQATYIKVIKPEEN